MYIREQFSLYLFLSPTFLSSFLFLNFSPSLAISLPIFFSLSHTLDHMTALSRELRLNCQLTRSLWLLHLELLESLQNRQRQYSKPSIFFKKSPNHVKLLIAYLTSSSNLGSDCSNY